MVRPSVSGHFCTAWGASLSFFVPTRLQDCGVALRCVLQSRRAQPGYDASAYGAAVQYDAYGQPIAYDTAMQVHCNSQSFTSLASDRHSLHAQQPSCFR